MIRVCPARDTVCPHGMDCPYTVDRYECNDPAILAEDEYRKHVERINRTTDREIEDNERRRSGGRAAVTTPETQHERDCLYVTSDGPAPCTCKAGLLAASPPPSQEGLEALLLSRAMASYDPDELLLESAAALSRLRADLEAVRADRQTAAQVRIDDFRKLKAQLADAEAIVTRLTEALTEARAVIATHVTLEKMSWGVSAMEPKLARIDAALRTEPTDGK